MAEQNLRAGIESEGKLRWFDAIIRGHFGVSAEIALGDAMRHGQALQRHEQPVHIRTLRGISHGRHEVPDVVGALHANLRLSRRHWPDLNGPDRLRIEIGQKIKRAGGRMRAKVFEQKNESEEDRRRCQPEPGILRTHDGLFSAAQPHQAAEQKNAARNRAEQQAFDGVGLVRGQEQLVFGYGPRSDALEERGAFQ
jgi:hypothetical protein